MNSAASLPTLEELRQHVLHRLCENDRLEPEPDVAIAKRGITRGDRPCGLFFQARGLRQLKTYALWAGEENRILFYNSSGEPLRGDAFERRARSDAVAGLARKATFRYPRFAFAGYRERETGSHFPHQRRAIP